MGKTIEAPAFVSDTLFMADAPIPHDFVSLDDPKAVTYAKRHLKQVREPIANALKVLALHGQDVTQAASNLKKWLDREVAELTD